MTILLLAALAVHSYARPNYAYTDDNTPAPTLLADMPEWARGRPFSSRHERGRLAVPASGEWRFRAGGLHDDKRTPTRCGVRIGDVELELTDGERSVALKKGPVPFRVFYPMYRTGREHIEWKGPGMASFEPIPEAALSHTAADAADASWQVHAAELELLPSNPHVRRYETTVAETGFYRLRLLVRGGFRWGSQTPYHMKAVIDGEEIRSWFTTDGRGGIFDEANETVFLTAGRHRLELHGSNIRFLGRWFGGEAFGGDQERPFAASEPLAPRVWLDKADESAYVVRMETPAASVYRLGETVAWRFRAARPGRTFVVSVRELRGATTNEIWRGASEGGRVEFPRDRAGAFEYFILDGVDGRVLEGPWEFLVVDPTPVRRARGGPMPDLADGILVDTVDCAAEAADGKGPHRLRDNDTSVVRRLGAMAWRETGPVMRFGAYGPKRQGMTETDWFAVTLKVAHPGRAHLLVAEVPTDAYRRNVIEPVDTVTGYYNGALYETRATEQPGFVKMVVPFWPNGETMDVLVTPSGDYHGMAGTPTAIGRIALYEFPGGFAPMPEAAAGWRKGRTVYYSGEQGDLGPEKATTPLPWNDGYVVPTAHNEDSHFHYDYKAYFQSWDRYAEYAAWNGDTRIIWPLHSYDMAHVKTKSLPWGNEIFCNGIGFRDNDKYTRDTAKLILLACERHGIEFVGDIQLNSDPVRWGSTIADLMGIGTNEVERMFLTDGRQYPAQNLNPAHPLARRFLVGFYREIAEAYGRYPAFKGIAIRNLPWATSVGAWFHHFTVGYDGYTTGEFARECGLSVAGATRDERYRAITGDPKVLKAWFDWRAEKTVTLRREILAAIREYAPGAILVSKDAGATLPSCGAGLDALRLGPACGFGLAEGSCARTGIENNAFEPVRMARFDVREGVAKLPAEQKYEFRNWYGEGVNTAGAILAPPYATEGFARALAERPLDQLTRGTYWCLPPGDRSIRDFIRAWRAIPSGPATRVAPAASDACAVWTVNAKRGGAAYVVSLVANPIEVAVPGAVRDLVSGAALTNGVVRVPPFGLAFVACAKTPTSFTVKGVPPKTQAEAFRGKSDFTVSTNVTWSAEKPYRVLVSDGVFDYGFTEEGLSYLAREGKVAFRGVTRQGDGSPAPQPLFGLCWYVPKALSVTVVAKDRIEVTIASERPTDVMTEVTAPDYGTSNFATGFTVKRTYALTRGKGEVAITDVFGWTTNPGLQVKNWGGYNASYRNSWAGSEPIEVTAFATVDKEKFSGVRTAKWNADRQNMQPWLGWSVPWAEVWNCAQDVGFDLATDARDGAGLEIGKSLSTRIDRRIDSAGPGQAIVRRYVRLPDRRQSAEEMSAWYRSLK